MEDGQKLKWDFPLKKSLRKFHGCITVKLWAEWTSGYLRFCDIGQTYLLKLQNVLLQIWRKYFSKLKSVIDLYFLPEDKKFWWLEDTWEDWPNVFAKIAKFSFVEISQGVIDSQLLAEDKSFGD